MKRAMTLRRDLLTPAAGLIIVQDGALVIFTTDEGRTQKFKADGKDEEHLTGDGVIKSKTRWVGEQLTIEAKIQDGPKVTRTYTLSSDRRQLTITTKIEGGGAPRDELAHHVYDRKPGTP